MSLKFVIICGTNKAGTTSLFQYLADHPQICKASVKQTGYFQDKEYKRSKQNVYFNIDLEDEPFDLYFKNCNSEKLRLEASPDYMYSPGTAQRIKEYFDKKKQKVIVVFILRNPVDRFISLYKYGLQSGELSQTLTFKQFYNLQTGDPNDRFWYSALETGDYYKYITPFYNWFSEENIKIVSFEEMKRSPKYFMSSLAKKLKIDESFYENYNFLTLNKSQRLKSKGLAKVYNYLRTHILKKTIKYNRLYTFIYKVARWTIIPFYRVINFSKLKDNNLNIDIETRSKVIEYYSKKKQLK